MTQQEKLLYTAKVRTTGGREGASRSSDGRLDIRLSTPGAPGAGTNPEQLFAAGWSACFLGAIQLAAARQKIIVSPDITIDAEVDLGMSGAEYLLRARLNVSIPNLARAVATELVEEAHRTCPYSKATRGNVDVAINLV